jgi:hypothetical protein
MDRFDKPGIFKRDPAPAGKLCHPSGRTHSHGENDKLGMEDLHFGGLRVLDL